MKKQKILKILTVAAFILFIADIVGKPFLQGFKDGYENAHTLASPRLSSFPVCVNANVLLPKAANVIKVNKGQSIQDVEFKGVLNNFSEKPVPVYLTVLKILTMLWVLYFLISIIYRGYNVIVAISNNQAFELLTIKNLNILGYFLIGFFVANAILEKIDSLSIAIMARPIAVIDHIDWHPELLFSGFIVLSLAQAFKQGMQINEEHKLTI